MQGIIATKSNIYFEKVNNIMVWIEYTDRFNTNRGQ